MRSVLAAGCVEAAVVVPDLPEGVTVRVAVDVDARGVGEDEILRAVEALGGFGAFAGVADWGGEYAAMAALDSAGGRLTVRLTVPTGRPPAGEIVESELVTRLQRAMVSGGA